MTTVGELEVIEAMKAGDTILVDGRTPDWYVGGTIPGAINIPYTQAIERLAELGCEPDFDGEFDCVAPDTTVQFCGFISQVLAFSVGDTLVTARVADVQGNLGPARQLIIRIR